MYLPLLNVAFRHSSLNLSKIFSIECWLKSNKYQRNVLCMNWNEHQQTLMRLAPPLHPPHTLIAIRRYLHIHSHSPAVSSLSYASRINGRSASASHWEDQSQEGGGSNKAVMCFHRGVLCLGKCNRLEYQWDVPESVTAHLLSDCGFGTVSLRSGGRVSFL